MRWIVLVLLVGCAAPTEIDEVLPEEPVASLPALELGLGTCRGVGGLAVYPMDEYPEVLPLPEGIALTDIRPYIGDPKVISANGAGWWDMRGPLTGHWHVAMQCDEAWGFVGIAIEPPFGTDAPLNFLLAVFSWEDPHLVHDHGHATASTEVSLDRGTAFLSMVLEDEDHGRYEGTFPPPAAARPQDGLVRFWMLLPTDGHHNHHDQTGPFTPVSFDLDATWSIAPTHDTTGFFMHSGTDHHAPLPALGGNALGISIDMTDAILTDGPRPPVQTNTTWVH